MATDCHEITMQEESEKAREKEMLFVQLIRKISANHVSNLLPLYDYVFIWVGKETENLNLVIFSHGILIKVKEKFVWTLLNLRFDVFIWKILLYLSHLDKNAIRNRIFHYSWFCICISIKVAFYKINFLRFSWKRVRKKTKPN